MADQTVPSERSATPVDPTRALVNVSVDPADTHDEPPLKKHAPLSPITLHIRYKTQAFAVQCDLHDTLKDLKEKLDQLTDVDPTVQKLVNKSITSVKRDDATTTLKDLNIIDGQTLLLIGATRSDIRSTVESTSASAASAGSKSNEAAATTTTTKKEPLCKQTRHEKVLKQG